MIGLSRRRVLVGLIGVGALASPAVLRATRAQSGAPKLTLTMGGDGLQFVAQHIAFHGGLFRAEGLEAETLDVGSGPRQVAALMSGASELSALGLIHVIKANANGAPLRAVSTVFNAMDIQIVLSNAAINKVGITDGMSTDEKVKRLVDIRMAVSSPGSTTDTYLRNLFRARRIDPDKAIQIQPVGGGSNMLAALERGSVDGFAWGAPQAQLAAIKGLGRSIINPFKGAVPEVAGMPYLVMVTTEATLRQKPEVIRRSVRAMARGMSLAAREPTKAKETVRGHFKSIEPAVFDAAWEDYRVGIPRTAVVGADQFQRTMDWLKLAGPVPPVTYGTAVSSSFAEEANAMIGKLP